MCNWKSFDTLCFCPLCISLKAAVKDGFLEIALIFLSAPIMLYSRNSFKAAAGFGAGCAYLAYSYYYSYWARESGSKPNEGSHMLTSCIGAKGAASICARVIASLIYCAIVVKSMARVQPVKVANDPTKKKLVLIFKLLL